MRRGTTTRMSMTMHTMMRSTPTVRRRKRRKRPSLPRRRQMKRYVRFVPG